MMENMPQELRSFTFKLVVQLIGEKRATKIEASGYRLAADRSFWLTGDDAAFGGVGRSLKAAQ
jgi:hypothetical protein